MQIERNWHSVSVDEALHALESKREGLSDSEVTRRQKRFGLNRLPAPKRRGPFIRFVHQFHSVLIYVLLAAAFIAATLDHWTDMAVILGVVAINAVIGFIQEGRAEQAIEAIRNLISLQASVVRNGVRASVPAETLVPGDIVILDAGDRVPADLRLLRVRNLRIDESLLTGESVSVEKTVATVTEASSLADRFSLAFSGTMVAAGHATGIVVATGQHSEIGRISELLGGIEPLTTPLVRKMNRFARHLAAAIIAVAAFSFLFATFVRTYPAVEAFIAAVALAVAAIPEGLPAVMTIALAAGVQRMAARHAIVRRLPAVETLGSVSVICSDKTGTLTRNEMTVSSAVIGGELLEVTGVGYSPRGSVYRAGNEIDVTNCVALAEFARAALLCNDATLNANQEWSVNGDPMEGALLSFALKAGLDVSHTRREFPRADEIPFDAEHRFMATLHHGHADGTVVYVKGAPEIIIDKCETESCDGEQRPVDRASLLAKVGELAAQGQRVLAMASKPMTRGAHELDFTDISGGLRLLGFAGLIDPPRLEAIEAVAECQQAGIEVKMITGDHAETARAIAGKLGIRRNGHVVTGAQLEHTAGPEFTRLASDVAIFARVSPEQKLRIVQALQSRGHVVAMTGDGVNDAPSLKCADVGVAMGRKGTEAAKDASEIVLADDNFASIVAAIREGRTVYDNLTKVIAWTLPTNGGEALIIIAALLVGEALPISPVQILWINMVTGVTLALALVFEPAEPDIMRRPPRAPDEPLLSGLLLWRVVLVSILFVVGAFGMFHGALARELPVETARTIVVNAIVVFEIFYLFNVRYLGSGSITWRGMLGTRAVWIAVAIVVAAQFAFTYVPIMQAAFGTRAVSLLDGVLIVAAGVVLLILLELEKAARKRPFRAA